MKKLQYLQLLQSFLQLGVILLLAFLKIQTAKVHPLVLDGIEGLVKGQMLATYLAHYGAEEGFEAGGRIG